MIKRITFGVVRDFYFKIFSKSSIYLSVMERKAALCSMKQCQLLDSHQKPVKERERERERRKRKTHEM